MSIKDRHRSITVRGLVCPSEWDSEGNACRCSIFTFDDDEYEVQPMDAGEQILDFSGQEVMLRGHLVPGYRRRNVIHVKSFTVFGAVSTETIDFDSGFLGASTSRWHVAE